MCDTLNRFFPIFALGSFLSLPAIAQDTTRTNQNDQLEETKPNESMPKAPRDVTTQHQQLLETELNDDTLVWLETAGKKFIALWERDTSGNPFGAVLMLHGEGQTADWPTSLGALRNGLTRHGWSTLSISLPPQKLKKIPSRNISGQTSSNNESTDTAIPPINTDQHAQERIATAMAYLNQNGQYNIVLLGEGLGAKRAAEYMRPESTKSDTKDSGNPDTEMAANTVAKIQSRIRALILINARNVALQGDTTLPNLLRDRMLPVLDLYYGDHYLDESEAAARLLAAKKHRLMYFQQFKILEPSSTPHDGKTENRLTRRIRGFLNKYAKGVEVEGVR